MQAMNQDICNVLRIVRFGPCALDCDVDIDRALAYLGRHRHVLPDDLQSRLEGIAASCERESRPRGMARTFRLERVGDAIRIANTDLMLTGKGISRHLDGCELACLVAVTLGMENERLLARAQAQGMLDGLLMDACSSSMAEGAARAASALAEPLAHEAGLIATRRFSPGYGDLPLEVQPAFLDALDARRLLGIHVGPSQLMTPMKSVTAIIGLKDA